MAEVPTTTPSSAVIAVPQCPICLRPMATPHKYKTLYGVKVCNKCRNGFANRRQAAYIVDAVIYILLTQTIVVFLAYAMATYQPAPRRGFGSDGLIIPLVSWLVIPFLFTFKDAFKGRSPGKMLFGVRVVDVQTREPISPSQSIKRNLVLMIPYVGVIGSAVTMMRGQRWGDKWANSMVIWNKHAFREPFSPGGRYCRGCGYDLTGNVSGRCPECGLDILVPAPPVPIPAAPAPLQ